MNTVPDSSEEYANAALAQMFLQAQAQFGDAVKAFWFYDDDDCPGCRREIDALKIKGRESLSLNAFIYREKGILIGYFLCSRCAKQIFRDAKQTPGKETSRHAKIETNLVKSYLTHMHSMDA